jgi:hypothetical protein
VATFSSTTAVGLLSPRSMSESIERLTSLFAASASSVMPSSVRRSRTRVAMRELMSGVVGATALSCIVDALSIRVDAVSIGADAPGTRRIPDVGGFQQTQRMHNPWLDISLQDYEGHMSLPSIGQAQVLADQFERLMKRELPSSVAVIGCAGGNGLDRIAAGAVGRVVAVDINREYIDETSRRYSNRLPCLDLHCADVQSDTLRFEPVDPYYAALLSRHSSSALATLKRNCRPGGVLAAVLQLPHPDKMPSRRHRTPACKPRAADETRRAR